MPIGSSLSTAKDGNTHKVTTRVWYVPTGGPTSETFDVDITWSPLTLSRDTGTNPNPTPGGGFVSDTLGVVAWSNQTVGTSNPESNPLEYEVTLNCEMRALTSVESTVGIVSGGPPSIYTAAIICQNSAN